MYRAIIFDFDYTLGDATEGIVQSVSYALEQLGESPASREAIRRTIGLSLADTYAGLSGDRDPERARQFAALFKARADEVMVANTRLYPGVLELLGQLKTAGIRCAIVTTKFHYRIEQILEKFDAGRLIDLIVGAEDVRVEKPDPEGLLWAMEHLSVAKHEALYVGDSLVDAKTAQRAAVAFAAVLTGTTTEAEFEALPHVFIGEDVRDIAAFVGI